MPISLSEEISHVCSACGQSYQASAWIVLDADERPDLVAALRDGELQTAICPACGQVDTLKSSLCYHDPASQLVYLVLSPDLPEYRWHDETERLLALLSERLSETADRSYLDDAELKPDLEALRQTIMSPEADLSDVTVPFQQGAEPQDARAKALAASIPGLQVGAGGISSSPRRRAARHAAVPMSELQSSETVLDAIQQLLAANSQEEFDKLLDENPILRQPEATVAFAELAALAEAEGQAGLVTSLRAALSALHPTDEAVVLDQEVMLVADETAPLPISEEAYQEWLQAESNEALLTAIRGYPALLEPEADMVLSERGDAALEAGNERLAVQIEDRREHLAVLRVSLLQEEVVRTAARDFLAAQDQDALEQAVIAYPALLTRLGPQILFEIAVAAEAQGDTAKMTLALERRSTLQDLREGLS